MKLIAIEEHFVTAELKAAWEAALRPSTPPPPSSRATSAST